jgi:pentatricopeptide repeat protein
MYNTVLKAWRDSELDIAATNAEELLSIMEQQNLATDISYQTVMDCFANKNEPAKTEEIFQRLQNNHADFKPNARLHNVRIKAWAQSGHVERAEAILREMEDRNMTNSVSYSTVMHGWAKQNNVERTLEVFNRMRQMYESGNNTQAKPNYVSYVTLIDAIVKAGGPGAAQRSEDVLLDMVERYKAGDGDVKPTSWITTTVIDAWGKSGVRNAGEKAEALLDWLLEMFETNGDVDFMPGAVTFSAVVNAHARSRYFGKAVRARAVLQKMIDLYKAGKIEAKPNVFVFTGVINACAYTVGDPGEKADAMQIAASTFNELCSSEYGEPNHVCYSSYITAVRNLLPDGELKTKTAIGLFNKCREDGQVGDIVVKTMSSFLSPKQLEKIGLGHNAKALPKEWRCNVIDRRRSDKKLAS